jgi:hypothetical protein
MLRSTRRGLETWQGRNASTPAGAPVLDPTCERLGVQFPGPTRHEIALAAGFDSQNAEAVLGIMQRDAVDQTGQNLGRHG